MLIKMLTKVSAAVTTVRCVVVRKVVNIINGMEPAMEKLSDDELKAKKPLNSARAWKRRNAGKPDP